MEPSLQWILFFSVVGALWLIFTPFALYCLLRYKSHRNDIIIVKRLPNLTILFGAISIITLTIGRPWYLLKYTLCEDPSSLECPDIELWHFNVLYYGYFVIMYGVSMPSKWIILLRFWLLFYEANWVKSTMNRDWKIHLNPLDVDNDWYLNHKSTFGRFGYCARRMCVLYGCCSAPILYLRLFVLKADDPTVNGVEAMVLVILPTVIMVVMALKMQCIKFKDKLHIIQELRWIVVVVAVSTVIFPIISVVIPSMLDLDVYLRTVAVTVSAALQWVLMVYIQTLFVLQIIAKDELLSTECIASSPLDHMLSTAESAANSFNTEMGGISARDGLERTFRCDAAMTYFIRHLANEWCVEVILAFIEISQFQKSLMERFNVSVDVNNGDGTVNGYRSGSGHAVYSECIDDAVTMELGPSQRALLENDSLPRSLIVHHPNMRSLLMTLDDFGVDLHRTMALNLEDELTAYKLKAFLLFQKYVDSQCGDLEINISHRTRRELTGKVERSDFFTNPNLDAVHLFLAYKPVIEELYGLLNHSHIRFRQQIGNLSPRSAAAFVRGME